MDVRQVKRKTTSLCSVCKQIIPAEVFTKNRKVFLRKICQDHGEIDVFLGDADLYEQLDDFYFKIRSNKNSTIASPELIVNFNCNMNCPVCYLGHNRKYLEKFNPSLDEIDVFTKNTSYKSLVISGAEATCRNDLFEIIKILKKYRKTVSLNTNALKLADYKYVAGLKKAGIDRVNVQFSGFDAQAEKFLRGDNYIGQKIKALRNLNNLNISIGLNLLIAGGCNEKQMIEVLKMVPQYGSLRMINFSTMVFAGGAENFPQKNYLVVDDLLKIIQVQTKGIINREDIYIFKKLELVISSFLNKFTCFYHHAFLIIRKKNGYMPISNFLNLKKTELILEKYNKIYQNSKFLAKIFLIMSMPYLLFINWKILKIFSQIWLILFSYFLKRGHFLRQSNLVYLQFCVECDKYRIDHDIFKSCTCKSLFFFDKSEDGFRKVSKPVLKDYWMLWK
ncbi:MAG: radical SAM protein [Candidatus Omnitrophota bacterium]